MENKFMMMLKDETFLLQRHEIYEHDDQPTLPRLFEENIKRSFNPPK